MDIFIEEMVAKKKNAAYFAKVLVLVGLCLGVVIALLTVGITIFAAFAPIIFLVVAGLAYGTYFLIVAENVEFEYSLVNNEIDVDKISNRKKRVKVTTVNICKLDDLGTRQNPNFFRYLKNPTVEKIFACDDKNSENLFFLVYNENTVKKMLIFSPSDRIVDVIKKFNPQKALI